ncbi:MAG TPA: hypothetical protein VF652_09785 [Allosphingosinicella sp.]
MTAPPDQEKLLEEYPDLSDFLSTVAFSEADSIYPGFEEALDRFVLVTGEDKEAARASIRADGQKFWAAFAGEEEQLDAFLLLGGQIRNRAFLERMVPRR